jgi:PAS domain S-box-containing protein
MAQSPENNPYPVLSVDCQALIDENRSLKEEIQLLRLRLEEPEELQRAIREGDVDALVMPMSAEDLSIFLLDHADSTFHTLAEIANEDLVVVNADLKITYIGTKLLNKIGYTQAEVIGKSWIYFVDREYKTVIEQKMQEAVQGSSDSFEIKLVCKNSSSYWVLISAKPLFDETGNFKGGLAMLTDITERKLADDELREAYKNLQAQSEALQSQSEVLNVQNEELQSQSNELNEAYGAVLQGPYNAILGGLNPMNSMKPMELYMNSKSTTGCFLQT